MAYYYNIWITGLTSPSGLDISSKRYLKEKSNMIIID